MESPGLYSSVGADAAILDSGVAVSKDEYHLRRGLQRFGAIDRVVDVLTPDNASLPLYHRHSVSLQSFRHGARQAPRAWTVKRHESNSSYTLEDLVRFFQQGAPFVGKSGGIR